MSTKYSYSTDEEFYTGEYDSPEAAAIDGFHENEDAETISVGEKKPLLEDLFDAKDIIESETERRDEEFGNDWADRWISDIMGEKEKLKELTEALEKVVKEWADRHDLQPDFWNVENVKTFKREQFAKELADV